MNILHERKNYYQERFHTEQVIGIDYEKDIKQDVGFMPDSGNVSVIMCSNVN